MVTILDNIENILNTGHFRGHKSSIGQYCIQSGRDETYYSIKWPPNIKVLCIFFLYLKDQLTNHLSSTKNFNILFVSCSILRLQDRVVNKTRILVPSEFSF